jgi:hypothetical protein
MTFQVGRGKMVEVGFNILNYYKIKIPGKTNIVVDIATAINVHQKYL